MISNPATDRRSPEPKSNRPWRRALALGALALGTLAVFGLATSSDAATWVVNSTGTGDDFPNIQAAIASSLVVNGDTIVLKDGTYTGPGNRDISFMGKNIVVRSMSMNAMNCIIDCQGSINTPHRAFSFGQGETAAAWLQKIKIVNGFTNYSPGAGIAISSSCAPVIDGCIIEYCIAEGSKGGGIACLDTSAPIIQNCTLQWNGAGGIPAGQGGGIFGDVTATPFINSCTVKWNIATSQQQGAAGGGGLFVSGGSIDFCLVSGNHSDGPGGGIHATGVQVGYSDIWSNNTTYGAGGGIFLNGGGLSFSTVKGNFGVGGGGLFAMGGASVGRCSITGNTSPGDGGGGVYAVGVYFDRCTISGNTSMAGGGISASNSTLDRTIVWGNCANGQGDEIWGDATVALTCCCVNTAGVQGAITYVGTQVLTNPQFCNPTSCNLAATVAGDYSLGSGSPCLPGGNSCVAVIGALPQGCISVDVAEVGGELAPAELSLPAVIRGPTEIAWSLPRAGRARLTIHDVAGRQVVLLMDESTATAGARRTAWSGHDDRGQRLPRGAYFARLQTSEAALTRKLIVLGE